MPAETAKTHGQLLTGAIGPAAGDTILGTIELPAGGPWIIWGVFCQLVAATATAGEAIAGTFRLFGPTGDIDPFPSPSRFPFPPIPAFLGATADQQGSPLIIHPCNYKAQGKGNVQIIVTLETLMTVAPQAVAGILFGPTIPVLPRFTFVDRVTIQQTLAAETLVGTVEVSERAKRIVAVCGLLTQDGVVTTAEELTGFFRLGSDDVMLDPMQLPFSSVHGAGLGALIQAPDPIIPVWIPVDIPVVGGADIDCFVDLNTAVTNGATVQIFIAYE